ncbi:MAG: hypothetical protein ACRDD7_16970 [Peptostreptococcaceae bacterium]
MNKISARIQGDWKDTKFRIENYSKDVESTIEEIINNQSEYENENETIISVTELSVEWDQHTDLYDFYEIEKFSSGLYFNDLDNEELEEISFYKEYDYIAVMKK